MSELDRIRRFEYRHCRHKADFSVEFISGGETVQGVCRDVSDEGIRAEFDGIMVVGSRGLLILHKRTGALKLEAQVAYIKKRQVGLNFLSQTAPGRGKQIALTCPRRDASASEEIR